MQICCTYKHLTFKLIFSPNKSRLRSMEDLLIYLHTEGTCKCGLECPFKPDQVFNFDPKVQSRFGMLPNGVDQNRQINCVVCKKFEELYPQIIKTKPTRGRKPGGVNHLIFEFRKYS